MGDILHRALLSGPKPAEPSALTAARDAGYPAAIPASVEYPAESSVGWVEALYDGSVESLEELRGVARKADYELRDHGTYAAPPTTPDPFARIVELEQRLAALEGRF